ncbi:MAG: hypothetical protein JWN04_3710 [Myxococcaceae bacterium]|nr:hypothetical protein [Myxococcaceae bacterium]
MRSLRASWACSRSCADQRVIGKRALRVVQTALHGREQGLQHVCKPRRASSPRPAAAAAPSAPGWALGGQRVQGFVDPRELSGDIGRAAGGEGRARVDRDAARHPSAVPACAAEVRQAAPFVSSPEQSRETRRPVQLFALDRCFSSPLLMRRGWRQSPTAIAAELCGYERAR